MHSGHHKFHPLCHSAQNCLNCSQNYHKKKRDQNQTQKSNIINWPSVANPRICARIPKYHEMADISTTQTLDPFNGSKKTGAHLELGSTI